MASEELMFPADLAAPTRRCIPEHKHKFYHPNRTPISITYRRRAGLGSGATLPHLPGIKSWGSLIKRYSMSLDQRRGM